MNQAPSDHPYINKFGYHFARKLLGPQATESIASAEGSAQQWQQCEPRFHRAYWRSSVRYPWELSKQADDDAKCDENAGFEAEALFVDVTFDFLVAPFSNAANHRHSHTINDTKDSISVAIQFGALAAIPSINGLDYHYVRQNTLTREDVHNHCREVNVDPIHTDADMVADILATSFVSNTSWQVARKVCEKSGVKSIEDPNSVQDEQLWQVKLCHKGQLEGETGFLPLVSGSHNDCLGEKVGKRVLDMILLQSSSSNCVSIPDKEGRLFWENANKCVLQEINTMHHTGDGLVMETAPMDTKPATAETNVTASLPQKEDSKTEQRARPRRSSTPVETTMYAPAKKTYIARSKKKKPKFTLGSL